MLLLEGHRDGMFIEDLCFSGDGSKLVSVGEDGTLRLWDMATRTSEVLAEYGRWEVRSVNLSPDGNWLVWGISRAVHLRHLPDGTEHVLYQRDAEVEPQVRFSPDGTKLVTADSQAVAIWEVGRWDAPLARQDDCGESTSRLEFSPDGRWLATSHVLPGPRNSSRRFRVRVRRPEDAATVVEIDDPTTNVSSLSFSPDGSLLAFTYSDAWCVVRTSDGEGVGGLSFKHREFFAAAFVPHGRHLALCYSDLTVRFHHVPGLRQGPSFRWNVGRIRCLRFSPDGCKAAGGGNKGIIAVWDVDL
jgi:WD40 repeat protein